MTWTPKPLPLHWPIQLPDGSTLDTLHPRAFTVEEHRAALARAGADEDARFEELAVLATGLTLETIEELKRPDYVSLSAWLAEYVNQPAYFFTGQRPENPDDVPLLVPIRSFGQPVERIRLQVPTMKATKVMMAEKDPAKAAAFISSHCTGIAPGDIVKLSLPDWHQLQGRLGDFLNKPADYFRNATSK